MNVPSPVSPFRPDSSSTRFTSRPRHPGFSAIQGYGRARRSAGKSGSGRARGATAPLLIVTLAIVAVACSEGTSVGPEGPGAVALAGKGKPSSCYEGSANQTPLRITIDDAVPGAALQSDGLGDYVEGADGGVHLSVNGNLMFWTAQYDAPTRQVAVTTSEYVGPTTDRIYTNTHDNPGGNAACGFVGMANGSTGSADFTVELDDSGIVHYGKACDGSALPANRVATTRSADGGTWTVSGTQGVYCLTTGKGKNKSTTEGTAGGFFMTLVSQ